MFGHLMQNKLLSVDGELEKDRFNGLETRELNDTEKFTSPVLWRRERSYLIFTFEKHGQKSSRSFNKELRHNISRR